MRNKLALFLFTTSILCFGAVGVRAQVTKTGTGQTIITKFRIQPKSRGALYVTIGGKEKKIANEAVEEAWLIEGGRKLAYFTSEDASGMGSGGTLKVYDAQTNQHKKLVVEDDDVLRLKDARSSDGKTALLLDMGNEEGCAGSLIVVDATRGEVFVETAKLLSIHGDIITLGYFTEAEWEKNCATPPKKMRPYKTKTFSLSALLKRRARTERKSE